MLQAHTHTNTCTHTRAYVHARTHTHAPHTRTHTDSHRIQMVDSRRNIKSYSESRVTFDPSSTTSSHGVSENIQITCQSKTNFLYEFVGSKAYKSGGESHIVAPTMRLTRIFSRLTTACSASLTSPGAQRSVPLVPTHGAPARPMQLLQSAPEDSRHTLNFSVHVCTFGSVQGAGSKQIARTSPCGEHEPECVRRSATASSSRRRVVHVEPPSIPSSPRRARVPAPLLRSPRLF